MNPKTDSQTVRVELGPRSYDIDIASDQLATCARSVERWAQDREVSARQAFIVTDANVHKPHAAAVMRSLQDAERRDQVLHGEAGALMGQDATLKHDEAYTISFGSASMRPRARWRA